MTGDERTRRGVRLAGFIVTAGLALVSGVVQLLDGLAASSEWMIAIAALSLVAAVACAAGAYRLNAEIARER